MEITYMYVFVFLKEMKLGVWANSTERVHIYISREMRISLVLIV